MNRVESRWRRRRVGNFYSFFYCLQDGRTELCHSGPQKRNVSGGRWCTKNVGEWREQSAPGRKKRQEKRACRNEQSEQLDRFNWLLSICASLNPEGSTSSKVRLWTTALVSHHPVAVHSHAQSGKI